MQDLATSSLLTTVISVIAFMSAVSWLLLAKPLAIYKRASYRFAIGNVFVFIGMFSSLYRSESIITAYWLLADISLFLGIFFYKKAIYKLFKLNNNRLFDHGILAAAAFILVVSLLFPVDYLHIAILFTLMNTAIFAMIVYVKYHALAKDLPNWGATAMVFPTFIIATILFLKGFTLWVIPDSAKMLFLRPQFDSVEILWVYLIMTILINVSAIGCALMKLIFKIKLLADHDQLTALFNRHAIQRELRKAFKQFSRDGEIFSVVIIDIDHFKNINDTHGHEAGDAALRWMANNIRQYLRETDSVSRYGGEEFLLLLPGCNVHTTYKIAEKIRTSVSEKPFTWKEVSVPMAVSIGIADVQQAGSIAELIRQADKALYEAKAAGRNQSQMAGYRSVSSLENDNHIFG